MTLKESILYFFVLVSFISNAQQSYTIKGHFQQAKNAELELMGFLALKDTVLSNAQCDDLGNFSLSYPAQYTGATVLKINKETSLVLLLDKENFAITWSDLKIFGTIQFDNSHENDAFAKGIKVYQESETILTGLKYLKPLYLKSPAELRWFQKEIARKENALLNFLNNLPAKSYARYYLFIRKVIQDMPLTANGFMEHMSENERQFKEIDFSDVRLLHSGLYKELINGFYLLMESYADAYKVTEHTNAATMALLKSLDGNQSLKQEVAEYVFKQLEKRSLFKPAEELALVMLNDRSCSLDANSTALYEQYRKMGVGQKSVEISFTSNVKGIKKLSDISTKYKLIVFGSSWCPKCQEELPLLKNQYQEWKDKYNLEIVFVSLDTDALKYKSFVSYFPWISSCDYKGWKTKSAIDYFVFDTPTMYLIDSENKILLKPFSAGQLNSWLIGNVNLK